MGNFSEALLLLVVGIILVMVVLWLVGVLGTLIIKITNSFVSKESNDRRADRNIEAKKLAAIVSAVDLVTGGQGAVSSIHKKG